jgi:hypothetical protein
MLTPYLRKERAKFVKKMEADKESLLEKYVTKTKGKLFVNWEELMSDKHAFTARASEGVEPISYHNVLRYLEYKGILSLQDEGNFMTFMEAMDVGPVASMSHYRFRRKLDAERYAAIESKYERSPVKVAKILDPRKR